MSEHIHCDLPSCEKTRRADQPAVIPDPWLKVEALDSDARYGLGAVRHFCSQEHAAEALTRELSP